jgi:hypothetical protein
VPSECHYSSQVKEIRPCCTAANRPD